MKDLRIVLNEAGISQAEFAGMLKVSRTTVYKWTSGTSNPQSFVEPKVRKLVALLIKASTMELLPVDCGMPTKNNRDERMAAIRGALKAAAAEPADA